MQEQINQIKELTAKKHVKIWKLHKLGLTNKDVATALGTNVGHVYNVLKDYKNNFDRQTAAI
jgi:transcriptional regulator